MARLLGLLALLAGVQASFWPWDHPSTPAKPFSIENVEANAAYSLEKLLFKVGDVYSGVAGGHQFTTIWTRDFCHAAIGLLQREKWSIKGKEVPTTHIVLTTLKALLNVTHSLGEPHKSKIPRALDWFHIHNEHALTSKVLSGGAFLKTITILPMYRDVGDALSEFPKHAPLQGFFNGEDNVEETTDAGYLIVRAFAYLMPKLTPEELTDFLTHYGDKLRMVISFYSDPKRWGARDHRWFFTQTEYTEWKDSCKQAGASSYSNLQLIESLALIFELAKGSSELAGALVDAQLFGPRFGVEAPFIKLDASTDYVALINLLGNWTDDVYVYFYDKEAGLLRELSPPKEDEELFKIAHIDGQLQWLQTTLLFPDKADKISIDSMQKAFLKTKEDGSIERIVGINAKSWPRSEVSPAKQAIGLFQYHGTFAWSWWACWFAELAALDDRVDLAKEILKWVWKAQNDKALRGKKFNEYFSEVYDGTSIAQTLVYVSETPFLWGSSYCIRAANAINAVKLWQAEEEEEEHASLAEEDMPQLSPQLSSEAPRKPGHLRSHGQLEKDEVMFLQEPLQEKEEEEL